jgi:hypothetical protein
MAGRLADELGTGLILSLEPPPPGSGSAGADIAAMSDRGELWLLDKTVYSRDNYGATTKRVY